jgi:hypothetical protein
MNSADFPGDPLDGLPAYAESVFAHQRFAREFEEDSPVFERHLFR